MGRRWLRCRVLECLILCFVFVLVLSSGPISSDSRTGTRNTRRRRPLHHATSHLYYSNYGNQVGLDSPESEGSCGVIEVHRKSIPAGHTNETIIPLPSGDSEWLEPEECATQCCRAGPVVCQYAWHFKGNCFAVSCTKDTGANCLPQPLGAESESVYMKVGFSGSDGVTTTQQEAREEDSFVPTTTSLPTDMPTSSSRNGPTVTEHSATPHPLAEGLMVSFDGEMELTLPQNSTHITGHTQPVLDPHHEYYYKWKKVAGPDLGAIENIDKKDVQLHNLVSGVYVLRLTVSSEEGVELGVGVVNVTVNPPVWVKTRPVPIIRPMQHLSFALPRDSALFDASGSHNGHGSSEDLRYHWEEEAGPMGFSLSSDSAILQLHHLKQGEYRFKLKVTNKDGLSAVAYASVSVQPQPYYPPQAVVEGDFIIHIPKDEVTIDGSRSKANEGPLRYSWECLLRPGPLDMQGTSEALLQVMHITTVGDYLFRLKVTDSRGSSSTTNVSVVVLPEKNVPPVADPGLNQTVWFPASSVSLNGSDSYDDYKIVAWQWTQVSGPDDVRLTGVHSTVLSVHGLHIDESVGSPTTYQFQLTVWDYLNLTDLANASITYYKNPGVPPLVQAGPDLSLTLPQDTAILNGSRSYDDFGIDSFHWHRSEDSPAAGLVIGHSDSTAILVVSGLVMGVYNFTLTVTNRNQLSASDTVTVIVSPPPNLYYMLQLVLELDQKDVNSTNTFSVADKLKLQRVLSLMLNDITVDYDVVIETVRPHGMQQLVDFYALSKNTHTPLSATLAYQKLTSMGPNFHYPGSDFIFVKFEMKVCELPCSGHGYCDQKSHKCRCSRFWMENPFKAHFGKQETNCEWSIFYVVLTALVSGAVVFFLFWLTCLCCMRKRRLARSKRRVRYAILDRKHLEEGQEMLPHSVKGGLQQTSLMLTESDTEEELLFESKSSKKELFESRNGSTGVSPLIRTSRSSSRTRGGSTPS